MLAVRASCIIQFRGAFVERWYDLLFRLSAAAGSHPPMQHNSALVALAGSGGVGGWQGSTWLLHEL